MNWQLDPIAIPPPSDSRPSEQLTIAELADRTGLSARTLRYYEELGLLPDVRRRAGGRRVYGADEIERLRFIQRLKALGLSLGEIKQLNAVYAIRGSTTALLEKLGSLLDVHLTELDGRIQELTDLHEEMSLYRQHVSRRIRSLEQGNADGDFAALEGQNNEGDSQ